MSGCKRTVKICLLVSELLHFENDKKHFGPPFTKKKKKKKKIRKLKLILDIIYDVQNFMKVR